MRFASHAGRNPSATLSTVLAGPLGLTAPWRASGQWALALSAAVLALRIVPTDLSPAADTLLLLAVTPLLAAGWTLARRLHLQRQNMAASYVELALLPGLGSPESARVQLLRKAICRLAQLMLFPLVLIALMHWMRGFDPGRTALLLGIWSGACSGGALLCLIALSAPQLAGLRTALLMLPLVLATVASLVAAQMPIAINTTPALWVAAWLMVNAFHLGAGLLQLKRYRARAHPFLLD